MCTRKGYATSVSQLALATAALYFPLSIPQPGDKRSASQPPAIYSEFPLRIIAQSFEKIQENLGEGQAWPLPFRIHYLSSGISSMGARSKGISR